MYPGKWAVETPDKAAVIMARSGDQLTYRELDQRSCQLAQLWYSAGLRPGDHVCILMENNIRFFEVYWAAIRSGLYFTTINRYLKVDETAYIVNDSGSKALTTSTAMADIARQIPRLAPDVPGRCSASTDLSPGFDEYEAAVAAHPDDAARGAAAR